MTISGIIEDGVRDKLLATSAVTTLTATRIRTERIEEAATIVPTTKAKRVYAVITKESAQSDVENHAGGATTLAMANLTIGVFGPTWEEARNAGNAIRDAINATRGAFGNEWVSRCEVKDFFAVGAPPTRDDEVGVPGYGLSVEISYRTS